MLKRCNSDFHKFPSLDTHQVTMDCLQIQKIEAVRRMEIPQDMETVRSFLGLVNYLNQFSLI